MSDRVGNYILFGLLAIVPIGSYTRGEWSPDWVLIATLLAALAFWLIIFWIVATFGVTALRILIWLVRD